MPDKKTGPPEPPADNDDKALEERVKVIMDPKQPGSPPPTPETPADDAAADGSAVAAAAKADKLDDTVTDKAVDDIMANESDLVLAAEDATNTRNRSAAPPTAGWKAKLRRLVRNKWTWAAIVVVLLVVFGLPMTRYKILGLVLKKSMTITVRDSKSGTPVSNAEVQLAGVTAKTDANGQASLKAGVGSHDLEISKQYYQTSGSHYFVGFKSAAAPPVKLVATGRLVPIVIINKITGKPLKGVEIKVLDTTAKTDAQGQASVALPTTKATDAANLTLSGYNAAAVTVEVTDSVVKANSFALTPAGHIYFLSNQSGTIDIVKTNLDGSGRKTVLAGTGQEDQNTTSLLASRDWRYLVLKASRDSGQPALYLIDTSDDKVTQFDNSNADFNLIGWYGHDFIYDMTQSSLPNWQPGRQVLKSYDADNQQLNQLDQNQAQGDANNYSQQSFYNYYILNGVITYNTQWYVYGTGGGDTSGQTDTIRTIQPSGQGKKDYQSFPAATTGYIQAALYEPQAVYYAVYTDGNNTPVYYSFEDQAVTAASIDDAAFTKTYPTFLLSPSGNQTFWTELRDGQNSLFVGGADAQNPKQLASLSDYVPYGWYSDAYTLVSKNSSELYIMPATGLSASQQPLKISDYYKPAQVYNGYGYGYGGL
jgi:hypothetical protein